MPELAEVEYYRKQWNEGLGQKVRSVKLHPDKRVFRGTDVPALARNLPGAILRASEARGKQMIFRFSRDISLGLHLGMTGRLRMESANFTPLKHDHLVLVQKGRSLVFEDMRLFGRVLFHQGPGIPPWWSNLAPDLLSANFSGQRLQEILVRYPQTPVKALLLTQKNFPGLGNWMVDEILWQAQIQPALPAGTINGSDTKRLFQKIQSVCRDALKTVGENDSDLPKGWLFHERWKRDGKCPRGHGPLQKGVVGGRTTAWCAKCQKKS